MYGHRFLFSQNTGCLKKISDNLFGHSVSEKYQSVIHAKLQILHIFSVAGTYRYNPGSEFYIVGKRVKLSLI